MNRRPGVAAALSIALVCSAAAVVSSADAAPGDRDPRNAIPFDQARIIFELNATDRDAGIQILLDGEGWETVKVFSTDGKKLMRIRADGGVGDVGVTELFFESAEPSLDDLPSRSCLRCSPKGSTRLSGLRWRANGWSAPRPSPTTSQPDPRW